MPHVESSREWCLCCGVHTDPFKSSAASLPLHLGGMGGGDGRSTSAMQWLISPESAELTIYPSGEYCKRNSTFSTQNPLILVFHFPTIFSLCWSWRRAGWFTVCTTHHKSSGCSTQWNQTPPCGTGTGPTRETWRGTACTSGGSCTRNSSISVKLRISWVHLCPVLHDVEQIQHEIEQENIITWIKLFPCSGLWCFAITSLLSFHFPLNFSHTGPLPKSPTLFVARVWAVTNTHTQVQAATELGKHTWLYSGRHSPSQLYSPGITLLPQGSSMAWTHDGWTLQNSVTGIWSLQSPECKEIRERSSSLALEVPVWHNSLPSRKLSCLGCEKKPACDPSSAGKRLSLINFRTKEVLGLEIDPLLPLDKTCPWFHEGMQSTEQLAKPQIVHVLINTS